MSNWDIWLIPYDSSRGSMREHKFTATYWFGKCESAVRVLKRGRPVSRGRPGTIKPSGSLQRARLMTEPGSRFREIIAGHHEIILSSPALISLRASVERVHTDRIVPPLSASVRPLLGRSLHCLEDSLKGQQNAPFPPSLLGKEVADAAVSLSERREAHSEPPCVFS